MITDYALEKALELSLIPFAIENTEGSYDLALEKARGVNFNTPLTDDRIIQLINEVWDRVNETQEVM